ncbi:hypothetical protein ACJRO7_022176 [Eucalyptus globulus]|uniref:Uncharacterized protein n=1 Tax=Eucalyptus globulus TaxID=34317 RepID=A0ABD3KYR7_EUCGL
MSTIPNIQKLVELEDLSFGNENPKELIVPPSAFDPTSILTEPQFTWAITFPKFKSLELSHSRIQNLGFEYGSGCIPQLRKVVLTGSNLQRVSGLLSSLSVLSIQACSSMKSLPPVQNLINLSELELLNSAVEKIEGLGELQSLEVLAVSDCPIVLLEVLSNLTSLKRLPLKNCNSLNELNVAELT